MAPLCACPSCHDCSGQRLPLANHPICGKLTMSTKILHRQSTACLRSLNNRLVKQTIDMRKQVVELQESKAKLERDVLQAEQVAQASAAERDFYIQNHMDSEEDRHVSSAMFDIERMLSGTFICSQIYHYNQEREKWERGLSSYLQQVRDKQEPLQGEWSMDKVDPISYQEACISEIVALHTWRGRGRWRRKAWRLPPIPKKTRFLVELMNATEESHKAEMEELQRTRYTLQSEIYAASALDEESKRRTAEQNLEIGELQRKVIRLNGRIAEQVESGRVLSSTKGRLCKELQQTKNGFSRLSRENKEQNRSIRVLKTEMREKNILPRS